MVFHCLQTDTSTISQATPNHFITMFSQNALTCADKYLSHEKEIVTSVLKQNASIINLIVIGSGPAAYLEIAQHYQCRYVGVDPFYHLKEANDNNIIYFDCSFNDINRSQLPSGPCLFLFWFNVLHYLKDPVQVLSKIIQPEDIILYSTWSFENDISPSMNSYFLEVYRDSIHNYEHVINQIKYNNYQDCLINELEMVKKFTVKDNQVNRCTILYL